MFTVVYSFVTKKYTLEQEEQAEYRNAFSNQCACRDHQTSNDTSNVRPFIEPATSKVNNRQKAGVWDETGLTFESRTLTQSLHFYTDREALGIVLS